MTADEPAHVFDAGCGHPAGSAVGGCPQTAVVPRFPRRYNPGAATMTNDFDEQLTRTFDALAERMRATLAEHTASTVEDLRATAAAHRAAAVEAAAREATDATERAVRQRLEDEFAQREVAIREAARVEWFDAGLQQARAEALAVEQAREAAALAEAESAAQLAARHQEELAAVRAEATARLDAALTAARVDAAAVASEHEQAVAAIRAELDNANVALVEAAARYADELTRAHAAAELASVDHAAALAVAHAAGARATAMVETAQASLRAAEARIDRAAVERLLAAVRSLDGASSLSQTLDALAAAAQAEAARSAVFLVRGEMLRAWSQVGFSPDAGTGPLELPLAGSAAMADAVRQAAPQRVTADPSRMPAFASEAPDGTFVVVPLSMNGQVIAVLCGVQQAATDGGEWLATHYEVLARHAARVLESLTALRLAQLGAHPGAAGAAPPS